MIYLRQDFDLEPASPATRDRFVALAEESLVPGLARLGGRLIGAWFNHVEWWSQLTHVVELDSLAALDDFRLKARGDSEWQAGMAEVDALAPRRRESLLEPLGPVPVERLHEAIAAQRDAPEGAHTMAILEVNAGAMERFDALLRGAVGGLPIVASWRSMTGNPNEVIDLWNGDIGADGYRPNSKGMEAFFGPLREVAPRERLVPMRPLPYSPLR